MANTSWVLQTGDPYRWDHTWLIHRDDGFYRMGISRSYTALSTGDHSGTTNITVNGKTESKDNACVQDNRTGLMWSKTPSGSVGPGSDGLLHWDDHVDLVTHDGANGGYLAGELLTQDVTGETAEIRYVDDANDKIGVMNASTRPFLFANTVSSPSGGPDTITAWAQGAKESVFEYVKAANAAEYAGYSDWRIPNAFEMLSIMYYSVANGHAEPDGTYFTMPADTSELIWTSSHMGSSRTVWQSTGFDPNFALAFRFDTGYTYFSNTSWKCEAVGHVYLVRGPVSGSYPCVLYKTGCYSPADSGAPCDGYLRAGVARAGMWSYSSESGLTTYTCNDGTTVNFAYGFNDSVLIDGNTGLMWTRTNSSETMPYYDNDGQRCDAVELCLLANEDGGYFGYTDWRIPNLYEMWTLMHGAIGAPSWVITGYAAETWTCTPDPNDADKVFYTNPYTFFDTADRQSGGSKAVRLVRGGYTDTDL